MTVVGGYASASEGVTRERERECGRLKKERERERAGESYTTSHRRGRALAPSPAPCPKERKKKERKCEPHAPKRESKTELIDEYNLGSWVAKLSAEASSQKPSKGLFSIHGAMLLEK